MESNIKIEGNYSVVAGSTEWLKNKINCSKFRFASTTDNEPCVVIDFFKIVDEKRVKTGSKVVAFIDSGYSDSMFWKEYKENVKLIHSALNSNENPYVPTLFNFLTPNAKQYCDQLIRHLADELIKKVKSDNQQLNINVTVE